MRGKLHGNSGIDLDVLDSRHLGVVADIGGGGVENYRDVGRTADDRIVRVNAEWGEERVHRSAESFVKTGFPCEDFRKRAIDEEVNIVIQVNGKVRGSFKARPDLGEEGLKTAALALPEAKKWLEGKQIKKIIVVKGRLVSIVVI